MSTITAVDRIREALEAHGCQPRGGSMTLRARCPAHGSRGPTLKVSQGRGRALVHCHAGCEAAAVLDALGLSVVYLSDAPRARPVSWRPASLGGRRAGRFEGSYLPPRMETAARS